jgi:hypothetical protein
MLQGKTAQAVCFLGALRELDPEGRWGRGPAGREAVCVGGGRGDTRGEHVCVPITADGRGRAWVELGANAQ